MSRSKRRKVTVRVPNPNAPQKRRLKVPAHKVHKSKKAYQRRAKHQRPLGTD